LDEILNCSKVFNKLQRWRAGKEISVSGVENARVYLGYQLGHMCFPITVKENKKTEIVISKLVDGLTDYCDFVNLFPYLAVWVWVVVQNIWLLWEEFSGLAHL